jgi:hypothetical protein
MEGSTRSVWCVPRRQPVAAVHPHLGLACARASSFEAYERGALDGARVFAPLLHGETLQAVDDFCRAGKDRRDLLGADFPAGRLRQSTAAGAEPHARTRAAWRVRLRPARDTAPRSPGHGWSLRRVAIRLRDVALVAAGREAGRASVSARA